MKKIVFLLLVLLPLPCAALHECRESGRVILSSAPCDTTFVPLARYGIGGTAHKSSSI